MTRKADIESIEKATGKKWEDWLHFFDDIGAEDMSHTEIAKKVSENLDIESAGWWSQGITVAYEQHIGRRAPGQRSDGSFEISVTKRFPENREDLFRKVTNKLDDVSDFNGCGVSNVRTSLTEVRSYWRCGLDNDTAVTFAVDERGDGKSMLVIQHSKLISADQAEEYRAYWRKFLATI